MCSQSLIEGGGKLGQLGFFPCAHALAVLTYKKGRVEELCDKAFHKATNVRVYSHFVHALRGQKYWAYVDHHSVRSPISRRREEDEVGPFYRVPLKRKTVRCSICNGYGHNRRNCRAAPPSTSYRTAEVIFSKQQQTRTVSNWGVTTEIKCLYVSFLIQRKSLVITP